MNPPTPNPFPGIFMLAGGLVLASGAWWIYRPASVIVLGFLLLAVGFSGRSGTGEGQ
jgi:hypothetical protein